MKNSDEISDKQEVFKIKDTAKTRLDGNSILTIDILPSAKKPPTTINKDAKISEAITLMLMNNYSQLPVVKGTREVEGVVSWESISKKSISKNIVNDNHPEYVKNFLNKNIKILSKDTPLIDAIKIVLENELVLVKNKDKTLSGIITLADISSQFFRLTEPFLLLEQIEKSIRLLLNENILKEDLEKVCQDNKEKNLNTLMI